MKFVAQTVHGVCELHHIAPLFMFMFMFMYEISKTSSLLEGVDVIIISANTELNSQVFPEIKNWMMDRPGNEVTLSWIRHLH